MSFGLDNLPYGVVDGRCVVRYGDEVLALHRFDDVFAAPSLNGFLGRGRSFWEATRERVRAALESALDGDGFAHVAEMDATRGPAGGAEAPRLSGRISVLDARGQRTNPPDLELP